MSLPTFGWTRATDLTAALTELADGAVPYCGGTELLAAMGMGLVQADRLVSLRAVPELTGVAGRDGALSIGATTTHRELTVDSDVRQCFPLLATVAERVGNVRVRASGTIGGNLAFAEPRSDISTVLIAAGAYVVLTDGDAERRLPVADFLLGPYEPDIEPEELVLRIEVPPGADGRGAYRKVTVTERPVAGAALLRRGSATAWRLVVGAVGDEPLVADFGALEDIDPAAIAGEVDVVEDLSGTERYKRQLVEVVVGACREDVRADGEVI